MITYPLLQSYNDKLHLTDTARNKPLLAEVQQLLSIGGFYNGDITGVFNNETFEGFKQFKLKAYLEYPSILGKTTAIELLEIGGIGKHPQPSEAGTSPLVISKGKSFKLPTGEVVYCDRTLPGVRHFTWGEVTKNGARIPVTKDVVQRIINVAVLLDTARIMLGDRKMIITSWYRPIAVNGKVGGVDNSRHIVGDGVDFMVQGMNPLSVFKLLSPWLASKGGLGKSSAFTHLDARGYQARWDYGNA